MKLVYVKNFDLSFLIESCIASSERVSRWLLGYVAYLKVL